MLSQAYQSLLMLSWLDSLHVILSVIIAVYTVPLAWHIAFGKGAYTIRIGKISILKLEFDDSEKLKNQ